jgi:hypothetical protein
VLPGVGDSRYCGGFPAGIALLIAYITGGAPAKKMWQWFTFLFLSSACCSIYALIFVLDWSDLQLNVAVPGGAGFLVGVLVTGIFPAEHVWKNVEKDASLDSVMPVSTFESNDTSRSNSMRSNSTRSLRSNSTRGFNTEAWGEDVDKKKRGSRGSCWSLLCRLTSAGLLVAIFTVATIFIVLQDQGKNPLAEVFSLSPAPVNNEEAFTAANPSGSSFD